MVCYLFVRTYCSKIANVIPPTICRKGKHLFVSPFVFVPCLYCLYVYVLICCLSAGKSYLGLSREYLTAGYGLRFSTEIYGSKREKTALHENLQEGCFMHACIHTYNTYIHICIYTYIHIYTYTYIQFLQKSPKVSGNLQEFTRYAQSTY